MNAFKRAVELKPDDAGLQKALKKSTDRLKSLEAAAAGQRGGDLHASSHAVPDLPRPSGTGRTSNEKVRQKVSTKAPLRGLYNDKEVTRMYEWGPLPENGEYNGGYLTSGPHSAKLVCAPCHVVCGQSECSCVHDLPSGLTIADMFVNI